MDTLEANTLEAEDIDDITAGRAVIDDLDAQIVRLVEQRQQVSRRVQQLRRSAGTTGIQYARENQVIARYTSELGQPGTRLALLLLELCRGAVGGQRRPLTSPPVATK